eukprot:11471548-Alexandrium_andersonii.AAC.1
MRSWARTVRRAAWSAWMRAHVPSAIQSDLGLFCGGATASTTARMSETMQAAWASVSTDHGMGRRPLTRSRTCSGGRVSAALSQHRRLRTG